MSTKQWGGEKEWPEMDKQSCEERGKYGFASSDVYSIDIYLAGVIAQMLKQLLKVEKHDEKYLKKRSSEQLKKYYKRRKRLKFVQRQMKEYASNAPLPISEQEVSKDFYKALKWLNKYWATLWF